MNLIEYLPYVIALAIACAIPGPGVTASVGTALGSGFRPALLFVTGIVLGDLSYLTFAVLGLTAIATMFAGFFTVVKLAGAAYLIYLAWSFWHAGVDPEAVARRNAKGPWATLMGGYALTLGNPKTIIFYMALLPTVVDLQAIGFQQFAILAVLTVLVLYAVCIPYIGLAARARKFLVNPRALKWLGRGAATAMASAAIFVVVRE